MIRRIIRTIRFASDDALHVYDKEVVDRRIDSISVIPRDRVEFDPDVIEEKNAATALARTVDDRRVKTLERMRQTITSAFELELS